MAELILFAGNDGATADQYQNGDIVEVMEDGAYSGGAVRAPGFFVVKLAGTKAEHENLKDSVTHEDGEQTIIDHKRKHNVDYVAVLGMSRVNEIINGGEWTVDEIQAGDITEKA